MENQATGDEALVAGRKLDDINVYLSYDIIQLFSEGLYQSPHKAVEELVSNSYDANAIAAHVILPDADGALEKPLWVIDDGEGMDHAGFVQLWKVASSEKRDLDPASCPRPPIGQFGIGKLAAYVLAWRLIHLSCVDGQILCTEMNFHDVTGRRQFEPSKPLTLDLRELSQDEAQHLLADVETRDPAAWAMMFGSGRASTWTAAGMLDFKDLYSRLTGGRLAWVLSTGLPLHHNFAVWLNGAELKSSKERAELIARIEVGSDNDSAAGGLGLAKQDGGVLIEGLGVVRGSCSVYETRLTGSKSEKLGRSNGFFVRVRNRVINLDSELFGLPALNHAAWAHFAMDVEADGLREYLLSSREGVREEDPVRVFRDYLKDAFNMCRKRYDAWLRDRLKGLDLRLLLNEPPSAFVTEPLASAVERTVLTSSDSYYFSAPQNDIEIVDIGAWMADFRQEVQKQPFGGSEIAQEGSDTKALHYRSSDRKLVLNKDHPFTDRLLDIDAKGDAALLFGSAEVLTDALLQEHGLQGAALKDFWHDRDVVLRLVAGEAPQTAAEVLRQLDLGETHQTALERAVGEAFRLLGFTYTPRGGNSGGCDGLLMAKLGRGPERLEDYSVVYDAKQTDGSRVPADKIDIQGLDAFRKAEDADYGFFVAKRYDAEDNEEGTLNTKLRHAGAENKPITAIRTKELRLLVRLHLQFGVTLARLRSLFSDTHTVPEVEAWFATLDDELRKEKPVPLGILLEALEAAKDDQRSRPNVHAVRKTSDLLMEFEPDHLIQLLVVVQTVIGERWIKVDGPSGYVTLMSDAAQIERKFREGLRRVLEKEPDEEPE